MRLRILAAGTVVAFGAVVFAAGCGQLLDASAYHVLSDEGDASSLVDGTSAIDSSHEPIDAPSTDGSSDACAASMQDARTCYPCAPTSPAEILNACTAAQCAPFDNASRIAFTSSGALPPLPPLPDAGTPDAGADAGANEAGAADAGSANPLCASLPNPLYATGSSAIKPFLGKVAQVLGATQKGTIVYQSQGSCVGVDALLNGMPMTGKGATGASYWDPAVGDPTQGERKCDLDDAGNVADLGASDVFPGTCFDLPQGLPANLGDFYGPVQVMALVVPAASLQNTISAEGAYCAFGLGNQSCAAPWTDETLLFQRNSSSGTQNMIARTIGVPATRWKGRSNKTSDDVRNALLQVQPSNADKALGILSSDYADDNRAQIRTLAFQSHGQNCGYWPDSTPTAADKANVRDGHYPMWGPLHLLARLGAQGTPIKEGVRTVLGYLTGTEALPDGVNLIQLYAERHLVPVCAMHVSRTSDGGPLASFAPEQPCSCYFDALVEGHTSCAACNASSECPSATPHCSYGYCEP